MGHLNLESCPVVLNVTTDPGSREPDYDMHYALEMGLVLSGRMRQIYREFQVELGPGQVWFCGMWELHGWSVPTLSCTHLHFNLLPEALLTANFPEAPGINWMLPFSVPPSERPLPEGEHRSRVLALGRRFAEHVSGPDHVTWSQLAALELLLLLMGSWSHRRLSLGEDHPEDYVTVDCAMRLLLESRSRVTARQAASACAVSVPSLRRAFQRLIGTTFPRFALAHRLGRLATELRTSHRPISQIAAESGFNDLSHLNASFFERYGVSPSEFRRRYESPVSD